jgi:hypothetical protein
VDGGAGLLFAPMGGTFFYKKDWKSGIGALIKTIKNPDPRIVFVRLLGGRSSHIFRLMNPYWFRPYIKEEQILLQIQPPIPLAELQRESINAEETSEMVRLRYQETFGEL